MLSILSVEDILDLFLGRLFIWVIVSFAEVQRQMTSRGVTATLEPEASEWVMGLTLDHKGEPGQIKIGVHMWYRLATEFASLRWLMDQMSQIPTETFERLKAITSNKEPPSGPSESGGAAAV
jgi:hypothetical protein